MISLKPSTVLLIAIVILNINRYETKTEGTDSVKVTDTTTETTKNTTNPVLVTKFMDLNSIIQNFLPNFNNGGRSGVGNFQNYLNGNQVGNPQGNNWNNGNWDAGSIHYPDGLQNYYPGQNFQGNNPQYNGNDFNDFNGGNYPVYLNVPQSNYPQYPGIDFNNFNGNNYPVNTNTPQSNYPQYPGNNYGGDASAYPVNPSIPQGNYPQYPGAGNNLDNNNNWNDNRYPDNNQYLLLYPNEQGKYPGSENWNDLGILQNNQNPSLIKFPQDQVLIQGVPQDQTPGFNPGQPQDPQGAIQNGNPGLQNGGSFNPQVSDGLNNLPNVNLQRPLLQNPQTNKPEIITSTTEKVAILGLPVIVSTETTQSSLVTTSTSSVMKQCVQDCPSTPEYNPICGSNNVTYFNESKMLCARRCGIDVSSKRNGACSVGPSPGVFG